ncbi:MAG: amidohydrolase family protein [Aggregatilineales bacterium]
MIVKNGECRLPSGTLAGSIITMNHALKNFQQATGASLEDLTRTVSLNPARIAGVASHKGKLASGYDADLVLLDDDLNVKFTIVMGQVAYRA